jgi:hypothetical protein
VPDVEQPNQPLAIFDGIDDESVCVDEIRQSKFIVNVRMVRRASP